MTYYQQQRPKVEKVGGKNSDCLLINYELPCAYFEIQISPENYADIVSKHRNNLRFLILVEMREQTSNTNLNYSISEFTSKGEAVEFF